MKRLINRRQQGDLGEASAIEWLTRAGATVFAPVGHSPDVDLVAQLDGRLLRVQVKTSVFRVHTANGHERYKAHVATLGGNQSWSGKVKSLDPSQIDLLFVLVGDGRRWLIPAADIEAETTLALGGVKYSEFEIEPGPPILERVYGACEHSLESAAPPGERRSRRAGPVCKIGALALSEFDSHLPHFAPLPAQSRPEGALPEVQRGTAARGQTRVSGNRQIVIPKRAFDAACLERGDRLKAFAAGTGEVVFRRIAREQAPNAREATQNRNGPPRGEGRPASGTR